MLDGSVSSFKETGCNSGIHFAGVGRSAFERSPFSPILLVRKDVFGTPFTRVRNSSIESRVLISLANCSSFDNWLTRPSLFDGEGFDLSSSELGNTKLSG